MRIRSSGDLNKLAYSGCRGIVPRRVLLVSHNKNIIHELAGESSFSTAQVNGRTMD